MNFDLATSILLLMGTFITLTTDFGLKDSYVASMKGVICSINPQAGIVDICHTIEPQNIRQAAFIFSIAYEYFPPNSIHLVIVDPGVGSDRRKIVLKTPRAYFVGPDNGVFSYVIDNYSPEFLPGTYLVRPGKQIEAYVITNSKYWREPVSNTFHGRDIFAPVGAALSLGVKVSDLGDRVDTVVAFPIPRPKLQKHLITGNILHIDNFGNLITNIKESSLSGIGRSITIDVSDHKIEGLVRAYADKSGPVALFGSSGYLEISWPNSNLAALFKTRVGDEVLVKPQKNRKTG